MTNSAFNVYTIGHSTHTYERFAQLLRDYNVSFVIDVRSVPQSTRSPQFGKRALRDAIRSDGMRYRYAGNVLGGRPADPGFYQDEQVQYDRVASSEPFRKALERIRLAARTHVVALVCAEGDPIACHRFLLVARHLKSPELGIIHILPDGRTEPNAATEVRILRQAGLLQSDMFAPTLEALEKAYEIQSRRVAYSVESAQTSGGDPVR